MAIGDETNPGDVRVGQTRGGGGGLRQPAFNASQPQVGALTPAWGSYALRTPDLLAMRKLLQGGGGGGFAPGVSNTPGLGIAPGDATAASGMRASAMPSNLAPGGGGASYMPAGLATDGGGGGTQASGPPDYAGIYGFRKMGPSENSVSYHNAMLRDPRYQKFLADAKAGTLNQFPAGQPGSQSYSPGDPYAPYSNDPRGDIQGLKNRIIGAGGNAGAFDPTGSKAIMDMIEQHLNARGLAEQGAAGRAASYFGGNDPASAGYAQLSSLLGSQGRTANAVGDAQLATAQSAQDWIRGLVGGAPDYAHQLAMQRLLQPQQPGTDWGAIAGGVGTGVGATIKAAR